MNIKVSTESVMLTLFVVIVVIALMFFIKRVLIKKVAYKDGKKKRNTFLGMVFNILQYVVVIIGIFVVLTVNGINVTGLLAGLGVVATIVGLSLQDTFKDLFAGINIYDNNFYKVGDFVRYNGEMCEVKFFNARISKFSSIATNSTYTVSNSSISSIEKIKNGVTVNFFFNYETDKKLIDKCLQNCVKFIDDLPGTKDCEYFGLTNISDKCLTYSICFSASPEKQFFIKNDLFTKAYEEFKKAKITPSFDEERTVYLKNEKSKKK